MRRKPCRRARPSLLARQSSAPGRRGLHVRGDSAPWLHRFVTFAFMLIWTGWSFARDGGPVLRHQDAAQVRMAVERDPEHVVDFALAPVQRLPHARQRRHARIGARHLDLHAQPLRDVAVGRDAERYEVQHHLEARLARQVVDAGDVGSERESQLGAVAQGQAHVDDVFAGDVHRRHAVGGRRDFHRAVRPDAAQPSTFDGHPLRLIDARHARFARGSVSSADRSWLQLDDA